jgi:hypothetical protein
MKSFGYCLWLVPGIRNKVINFTDGFKPHITIKKNLTKFQSFKEFKEIYLEEPIKFKLEDKYILSEEDNFYALYYKVSPLVYKPLWWPEDAHISFRYKYDKPFTQKEIDNTLNKYIKYLTFDTIEIRNCNGHFKNWEKISKNDI